MKKVLLIIIAGMFLLMPAGVRAQGNGEYVINSFDSRIEILQDTKIRVTETIAANFLVPKHGIFRVVPYRYNQVNINSQVRVEGVTDGAGNAIQYSVSTMGNDLQIKIGDPNITLTGLQTYVLTYTASHMVRRFADHDELYWNVTGSKWDTSIANVSATVESPWAGVIGAQCFSGVVGTTGRCSQIKQSGENGAVAGGEDVGMGKDMTIVVALDKNNQLVWPSWWEENWMKVVGYAVALAPAILMGLIWYKKGRDWRYKHNDNIYMRPQAGDIEPVPIGARESLPSVYTPIKDVTPAEAGTIIDQKVDISDVVAEIVELARRGYVELRKVGDDYWIINKNKQTDGLRSYQINLLKSIADGFSFTPKIEDLEKEFGDKAKTYLGKVTAVSKMNGMFRPQLDDFKNSLYEYLDANDIFDGRPDSLRKTLQSCIMLIIVGIIVTKGMTSLIAGWEWQELIVLVISVVIAFAFAFALPRRTAWGHDLYRQLKGLKYYLKEGKWRYDIEEKHLFLEEVLPLAVALGVVDRLARDMKGLGIEIPQYMGNVGLVNMMSFNSSLGTTLGSSVSSGSGWGNSGGGWSGGSGFGGGGSSGGGGGGGGGGSW